METWSTIESDPGVFTELIEQMGVKGAQVDEVYTLDELVQPEMGDVLGLIFLFKWQPEDGQSGEEGDTSRKPLDALQVPHLFFAQQMALLGILLNNIEYLNLGEVLTSFRSFTMSLPPDLRGESIVNSEDIRSAHNEFSRPDPFFHDNREHFGRQKDAFHFISYIPHRGSVYELDGLKTGPIDLGEIGDDVTSWLEVVKPALQSRIARYSQSEIRFNLMALVKNKEDEARHRLEELEIKSAKIVELLSNEESDEHSAELSEIINEIENCHSIIAQEQVKFKQWRTENVRRKHDFVPLALNLMKILADKGKLKDLLDKAKQKKSGVSC